MVMAVFVHMFSVFFMKAYRKPREFGWWSGMALLVATMLFGFSGYLLPMDELSYFATKVGLAHSRLRAGRRADDRQPGARRAGGRRGHGAAVLHAPCGAVAGGVCGDC